MATYCERLGKNFVVRIGLSPAREGRVVHLYLRSAVLVLQVRLVQSFALVDSTIF